MDKLISLSIRQVQQLYHDSKVLPSEFINMSLKRITDTNSLNAFTVVTSLFAEKTSQQNDKEISNNLTKSLTGIPIAIKDNFCTKGIPTTCASKMLENFIPTYNATVVSKLKSEGAVVMGKCNLDEFGMGSGTVDSLFGPTKNIWGSHFDKNKLTDGSSDWRIAGGSSGGCAVAVASGSCLAAIGSDTGGSTRNPASLCGLVGFKPTYGIVSRYGLIPLVNSMDVPGILTRNINDCIKIYNCIAGPDELDSTTIKEKFKPIRIPDSGNEIDVKGIKIGIPQEYHCEDMSPEVVKIWMHVANLLEKEGAKIIKVSMPYTSASIAVYSVLNQCEVASNMARYDGLEYGLRPSDCDSTNKMYATARSLGFNEVVRNRILGGNYFLLSRNYEKYFIKALKVRRLISEDFKRVFDRQNIDNVDILLTPTTLGDAPLYSDFMTKTNRDQSAFHDFCTQPANLAGVPALSLPITLSEKNLPLSLQLMGPGLSEMVLFMIAKKIETLVNFSREQIHI